MFKEHTDSFSEAMNGQALEKLFKEEKPLIYINICTSL